jgi:uncharacterized SAM-binding protein YcdF (DUF218 family)
MSFFLDKLLSVFAFPLGFAISAVVLLLIIGAMRMRRFSQTGLALVVAGLWIASTPQFASFALKTLEQKYPLMSIADTPTADVLIVLGGGIRPPNSSNPFPDLGDSSDRLVHALRLWKAGKAPKLLLVGRGNGWGSDVGSEGSAMAAVLQDFGIDQDAILVEGESRNTFENALYAKQIWDREGFRTGLLITSATHMSRSRAVFVERGFVVTPVPIDARAGAFDTMFPFTVLPDVRALDQVTYVWKEWLGLLVYRIRGWA